MERPHLGTSYEHRTKGAATKLLCPTRTPKNCWDTMWNCQGLAERPRGAVMGLAERPRGTARVSRRDTQILQGSREKQTRLAERRPKSLCSLARYICGLAERRAISERRWSREKQGLARISRGALRRAETGGALAHLISWRRNELGTNYIDN